MENLDTSLTIKLDYEEIDYLSIDILNENQNALEAVREYFFTFTKRYIKKHYPTYYDKDSLLSNALLGMEKALRTYDQTKGPLGAYIFFKIKHYILDAYKDGKRYQSKSVDYFSIDDKDYFQITDTSENVELKYEQKEMLQLIKVYLDELSPRDKKIVIMHFGIGCHPYKQKELAHIFKVTEPRISQIVAKALIYLKKRYEEDTNIYQKNL